MDPSGFKLSGLDTLIVLGSVLIVILVGLRVSRNHGDTARSYFLASDNLPWWIIGSAFVATSVSSEQIVGTSGAAYQYGMGIANWEWFALPTYSLLILFFIPVYLKNRITTVTEFLAKRFGPLCGDSYSWVMLLAYVLVFLVSVIYGGSLVFAELTGWNFYAVVWLTVVLVGLYTVKGGLASVMWTDAVQCLMLLGGGILLYLIALDKIPGGWRAMVEANPERFHLYRPIDDPMAPFLGLVCGSAGVFLFYQATNQVMIQRIFGARSTWDGIMGIIFAGFINFLRPMVTCFLGFVVYFWIHEMHRAEPLKNPDTAFPFALSVFAPASGVRGVVIAGFLAAIMSTISSLANSTATIFAMDIYKRWINKEASDRQLVQGGRVASMIALSIAGLICPAVERLGGIFRYFQTGVTYLATPFISVFLLGLFWRRANYHGAVFGVFGGLILQAIVPVGATLIGVKLHWLYLAFIAQAVTMIGIVFVSLITPQPKNGSWEQFVWRPSLLSSYDEGVVRPWYKSAKLWFGLYAMTWIVLYWLFW